METKDIVIIGGGPAGYSAAIRVAQLGGKVTLIESSSPGGTCVSRGCIPVKALVRAAELIDLGKTARDYGINFQEPAVDFAKMMARKDTVVKTVSSGVRLLLDGNGVELIKGTACFLSPAEIEVSLPDGTKRSLSPRRTIIAAGARPYVPETLNDLGAKVITTDAALSLGKIPGSLLIVGGGFVGLAFATIFSHLGSKVTVIEDSHRLLPNVDVEIVSVLEKELKKNKVQVLVGARHAVPSANGMISIIKEGASVPAEAQHAAVSVDAEVILVAEARKANIDNLGLDKAGVSLNDKGGIKVNSKTETSVPAVFAAGDVTMGRMFTHVAYAEGIAAAENAMGKNSSVDYSVVPLCTNTLPEIACFGMTEEQAKQEGYSIKVGKFPMAANAAATVLGQRTGLIKVIADEKYGQILGAHIVGPQASNLISEIALAAKLEATLADIGSLMHAHPTLAEVSWEASRDAAGQAIHMLSEN